MEPILFAALTEDPNNASDTIILTLDDIECERSKFAHLWEETYRHHYLEYFNPSEGITAYIRYKHNLTQRVYVKISKDFLDALMWESQLWNSDIMGDIKVGYSDVDWQREGF